MQNQLNYKYKFFNIKLPTKNFKARHLLDDTDKHNGNQ
jgi:hypothetical protein